MACSAAARAMVGKVPGFLVSFPGFFFTAMKATINGAELYYVEVGNTSAVPVIFIHGFPFSHRMWSAQLDAVCKTHRAIAYDVRGHGESDVGDGQYTIEMHVDDLLGLLDCLNISKTVVTGLSMGGYIALRALERSQERFLAAVLCDTRSEADSNEAKLRRAASIRNVKKQGSAMFAGEFAKSVFAEETFRKNPAVIEEVRKTIARMPPLAISGTLLALAARTDTTASLDSIRIPTMILVGEYDSITPPAAAREMHSRIPNSELHVIPAAAHMSNLENPEAFNEKLAAFLNRVSAGVEI
jgi:3-oxoadipate enol-lactonase